MDINSMPAYPPSETTDRAVTNHYPWWTPSFGLILVAISGFAFAACLGLGMVVVAQMTPLGLDN